MTCKVLRTPFVVRNLAFGPSMGIVNGLEMMNNPSSERLLFPRRATPPGPVPTRHAFQATTGGQGGTVPASDSTVSDQTLFLTSLPVIDDVTTLVCRRHRLSGAEAEDFASQVRLHFIERNSDVLRRFEGRSSLRTFLSVVIQRLFLDDRNRRWGKWRPTGLGKELALFSDTQVNLPSEHVKAGEPDYFQSGGRVEQLPDERIK